MLFLRRPALLRRWVPVAVAVLGLALPGAALGAGSATNPFAPSFGQSPVTTTQTSTVPVATTATTSTSSGGFGTLGVVLIGAGVVVLLGAIIAFVWRDSRRSAHELGHSQSGAGPGTGRHQGSKAPPKPRKLSAAERKRRKRGQAPRRR